MSHRKNKTPAQAEATLRLTPGEITATMHALRSMLRFNDLTERDNNAAVIRKLIAAGNQIKKA